MTRFEITIYAKDLFTLDDYLVLMNDLIEKMSRCLTYQISFENHWKSVCQRIRSTAALYDCENKTFAYCHWWNSLTKRIQGLVKGNVSEQHVASILANFTFNDRPMYYFVVRLVGNKYEIIQRLRYIRAQGCTSMTLVPGPGNSLVPSKYFINNRTVLDFALLGFTTHDNITLGWSDRPLKYGQIIDGVQLVEVDHHDETENNDQDIRDDTLRFNESVNITIFQADYNVMEPGRQYQIVSYGFGTFRNKEYLCVSTSCGVHIRCSKTLDNLLRRRVREGRPVLVRAIKPRKTKGTRDMICELAE